MSALTCWVDVSGMAPPDGRGVVAATRPALINVVVWLVCA